MPPRRFTISAIEFVRLALSVMETAIGVKEAFSLEDCVSGNIRDGHDLIPVSMTLEELKLILQPFYAKACAALIKALDGFDRSQIKHLVLGGGGSMTRGLISEFAKTIGVPVERFHVMSNPSHIVANGAANAVQRLKEGAQTIPKGFTLTVGTPGGQQGLILCHPEQVIPPSGIDFSIDYLKVQSDGKGPINLVAPIGELGHGVSLPSSEQTTPSLVSLDLIAELGHAEVTFDTLPAGMHAVCLNVSIGRSRAIRLGFSLPGLSDRDVQYVDVASDSAPQRTMTPLDLVFLLDTSGSMAVEGKLESLQRSVSAVISRFNDTAVRTAMITFGGEVDIAYSFATSSEGKEQAVQRLIAAGGTPMADAIAQAIVLIEKGARPNVSKAVILVTDGQPSLKEATIEQACRLRTLGATVITIGIGKDADQTFLAERIADTPSSHFPAENAQDAATQFERSVDLLILD